MTDPEYNACVDLHADAVYRFVLKNLRHAADAQDVVQTAFEKLWRSRAEVDGDRAKSYLFAIAYNATIDHCRRSKRMAIVDEPTDRPDTAQRQPNNARKVLEDALQQLPPTQRSLVMLKDYEGYSYEEIGVITGLNASQVKVYLHRARTHLKNYLVSPQHVL